MTGTYKTISKKNFIAFCKDTIPLVKDFNLKIKKFTKVGVEIDYFPDEKHVEKRDRFWTQKLFTVADMVSATSGGTFSGGVTVGSTLDVTGNVSLDGGSFVFNESSADKDFRIESNGDANMLFVDGGNDRVGIGTGTPSVNLHIVEDATEGTPSYAGATHLAVQASASSGDNCNLAITAGSAGTCRIMFGDKDDEDEGKIDDLQFIYKIKDLLENIENEFK